MKELQIFSSLFFFFGGGEQERERKRETWSFSFYNFHISFQISILTLISEKKHGQILPVHADITEESWSLDGCLVRADKPKIVNTKWMIQAKICSDVTARALGLRAKVFYIAVKLNWKFCFLVQMLRNIVAWVCRISCLHGENHLIILHTWNDERKRKYHVHFSPHC